MLVGVGDQVLFVDPADKLSGELLKLAEAFYVHNAPVRSRDVMSICRTV